MTFPTDDVTLSMLEMACQPDEEDGSSHLYDFLAFGSTELEPFTHTDPDTGEVYEFPVFAGGYHQNDVILALIAEVRQLRASHPDIHEQGCGALDWQGTCADWLSRKRVDNGPRKRWPWSRKNGSRSADR